jgi:hypothetical protein
MVITHTQTHTQRLGDSFGGGCDIIIANQKIISQQKYNFLSTYFDRCTDKLVTQDDAIAFLPAMPEGTHQHSTLC